MFACPTAISDDGRVESVLYYRAWKTWESSVLEQPLAWAGAAEELPRVWGMLEDLRDLEEPRIRRFAYFYFYPVGVDRFAMLFMSADGLLVPLRGRRDDRRDLFAKRGAALLSSLLNEPEAPLRRELGDYYDKRCGHFHGTSRHLGQRMQRPAERLELFVRLLLQCFLQKDILKDPNRAESVLAAL